MSDNYCNNCGKPGHTYSNCKIPITSFGVIAFRITPEKKREYLLIQRKDSLGFVDFMQGKYSIYNKCYLMNMLKQMTIEEKGRLQTYQFEDLWYSIWGSQAPKTQYRIEESISRDKFNQLKAGVLFNNDYYNLDTLIQESDQWGRWVDAEWGFPKGRRNYQEKDYECAVREFTEETGYSSRKITNILNISPFDEIFTGSNYKSYKHRYYLMYMDYCDSDILANYQKSEVSNMEWMTIDVTATKIRPYNIEKRTLITKIDDLLDKVHLICNI